MSTLDLVTVVFDDEIDLLRLQARSIDRFVAPDSVGHIFVLICDRHEDACVDRVAAMVPDYGRMASRVRVLRPDPLFAARPPRHRRMGWRNRVRDLSTYHRRLWPFGVREGWRGNRGWRVQQALKLVACDHGRSPFLLLLDAKNHFVRDVTSASFVSASGQPRSTLHTPSDQHRTWIEASFRLFDMPLPAPLESVPPTVTPFCVPRELLAACLEALEARVGPVETFFARRWSRATEFTLLYAYVTGRYGDWCSVFEPGLVPAATIYRTSDDASIDCILRQVESGSREVFSIHGSRLTTLRSDHRDRAVALWADRGLLVPDLLARMGVALR